jgi:hypothetical protein
VHSKKIGTVLSVGLIHLFFVLMSRSNSIKSYALWVNLFFDEADVAAAFYACESNTGKIICMHAKTHVFIQIMC